jgi:hypothetical protein
MGGHDEVIRFLGGHPLVVAQITSRSRIVTSLLSSFLSSMTGSHNSISGSVFDFLEMC